jgi:hypothetical protein
MDELWGHKLRRGERYREKIEITTAEIREALS